jgi:hypothetical protein
MLKSESSTEELHTSPRFVMLPVNFFEYLQKKNAKNLSMVIGYRVDCPRDVNRKLDFDIAMDNYDSIHLKQIFESEEASSISYLVVSIDFNMFCVLSNGIVHKFPNANKINKIVFDSSTFKFLTNIKSIALFYYLILEEEGSIYIESSSHMSIAHVILNKKDAFDLVKRSDVGGFHYQTGYVLSKTIFDTSSATASSATASSATTSSGDMGSNLSEFETLTSKIVTKEEVYLRNVNFMKRWFYGSDVKLLDNFDDSYPIVSDLYPVKKYYKITKKLPHREILNFISTNYKEYDKGLSLKTITICKM